MTKEELITKLNEIRESQEYESDLEVDHVQADGLLLAYINDPEVTKAFEVIDKWYA